MRPQDGLEFLPFLDRNNQVRAERLDLVGFENAACALDIAGRIDNDDRSVRRVHQPRSPNHERQHPPHRIGRADEVEGLRRRRPRGARARDFCEGYRRRRADGLLADVGIDDGHALSGCGKFESQEAGVGALAGVRTPEQQDDARPLPQNRRGRVSPRLGNVKAWRVARLFGGILDRAVGQAGFARLGRSRRRHSCGTVSDQIRSKA